MRAFSRALEDDRPGLWLPWEELRDQLRILPGNLVLVLGAPGALKSLFSLVWGHELARQGEPVSLISLDTDPLTQAARLVAMEYRAEGHRITTNEVMDTQTLWPEWLEDRRLRLSVIERPVSAEQIDEIITAHTEYWGRVPPLVIVDDVSKMRMEKRDYEGFDTAILELHRVARRHGTVVLGLHHVHRGDSSSRQKRVTLKDGKYTGEYEAEIMLGLWRPLTQSHRPTLRVSVLKNRSGQDDPTGETFVSLYADPARAEIRDFTPAEGIMNESEYTRRIREQAEANGARS